jgi:transcriptional regulator with XRE-family HTH domain
VTANILVGLNLERLLVEKGWEEEAFAVRLGMAGQGRTVTARHAVSNLQQYLRGNRYPGAATLDRWVEVLGVPHFEFYLPVQAPISPEAGE